MYLMVKIILLTLSLSLSLPLPFADKTQYFVHLSFKSTFQLLNGISSDLQQLLKYYNSTATASFFRIPLELFWLGWATVFPNNLALDLKDLKLSVFSVLLLKSFG